MRLKVIDQIHISSIRPDSLRPGDEIGVTGEEGLVLLAAHPDKFERLPESGADHIHAEKADFAPLNKMDAAPANKAAPKRKAR